MIKANERTVNRLSLAIPVRIQAASGRLLNKEIVDNRTCRNSSTCAVQDTESALAPDAAMF
jgi:hypothetical protein